MFWRAFFDLRIKELHPVRFIFAVFILGFAYGTRNHIVDILADGWLGYDFVPFPINLYWTLLTFFDPLAIFLLLTFPLAGIILSVLIMATDIAINTGVTVYFYHQTGLLTLDRLPLQIAFGIFVFLASPVAWKRVNDGVARRASKNDRPGRPPGLARAARSKFERGEENGRKEDDKGEDLYHRAKGV